MSRGNLILNYLEHPVGMAVMCLRGDLSKATSSRELRLILAHWRLADRFFRKKARRLGKRKLRGMAAEITGGITKEELFLTYLRVARRSLQHYGLDLNKKTG